MHRIRRDAVEGPGRGTPGHTSALPIAFAAPVSVTPSKAARSSSSTHLPQRRLRGYWNRNSPYSNM